MECLSGVHVRGFDTSLRRLAAVWRQKTPALEVRTSAPGNLGYWFGDFQGVSQDTGYRPPSTKRAGFHSRHLESLGALEFILMRLDTSTSAHQAVVDLGNHFSRIMLFITANVDDALIWVIYGLLCCCKAV